MQHRTLGDKTHNIIIKKHVTLEDRWIFFSDVNSLLAKLLFIIHKVKRSVLIEGRAHWLSEFLMRTDVSGIPKCNMGILMSMSIASAVKNGASGLMLVYRIPPLSS
ncbi:MAG: hypothetical protein AOA65_2340 [Candidatus Bathyarchaeota archaeon BA1]|nr:MAG: hypothetical protein AOA65_2340 [Candidatus Bathyarchaeota archaeon BA1]